MWPREHTSIMYSQVHIYLDTDIIFIILALYANRTELKIKQLSFKL